MSFRPVKGLVSQGLLANLLLAVPALASHHLARPCTATRHLTSSARQSGSCLLVMVNESDDGFASGGNGAHDTLNRTFCQNGKMRHHVSTLIGRLSTSGIEVVNGVG